MTDFMADVRKRIAEHEFRPVCIRKRRVYALFAILTNLRKE